MLGKPLHIHCSIAFSNITLQRRVTCTTPPQYQHLSWYLYIASPAAAPSYSKTSCCVTESTPGKGYPLHSDDTSEKQLTIMMKVSLLLLAVALICLQKVTALAVPVVVEEGLTMGRLSTNRRFLQSQYSQQNHSAAYSHHPSAAPSYHKKSTAQSHDTRRDKSTPAYAPSCRNNFQCASQTAYGQKKYKKGGCCNGRCVDLLSDDKNNCGSCGRKCSYGAVCCEGQCTRIYGSDCGNCGGCGKKCRKGVKCLYGICGYNAGSH